MANEAAAPGVTGVDIWDINASESIAYQYGRYNYNATDFWDQTLPFGASDHNPEIVGIDVTPAPVDVQILGTNDFHGRILNNTTNGEAGAAVLSGAVKQLRAQNPNTVFAAAGDLIGASTFESFIQKDKPTIDALNEAGLEVSAAGNHEFDAGYDDLVNRVMKPLRRHHQPVRRRGVAVHRGQRAQEERQLARPAGHLDEDRRRSAGRLRGCGHRGPALAGQPRRHR